MYFDDLYVQHSGLAVTQENHYYPFGLNIQALERAGDPSHLWQFQGQEKLADFGLGWAGFKWRFADPQLGRFMSLDPLSEKFYYNSTYAFSENKVTSHIELEGLEGVQIHHHNKDGEVSKIEYRINIYLMSNKSFKGFVSSFEEDDVDKVSSMLSSYFKTEETDPETGANIQFTFNVILVDNEKVPKKDKKGNVKRNKKGQVKMEVDEFTGAEAGIIAAFVGYFGQTGPDDGTVSFPGYLFRTNSSIPGTDGGKQSHAILYSTKSSEGEMNALGHELLHLLVTRADLADDHSLNGGLGRPITYPKINSEILETLKTSVLRASQLDTHEN